VAIKERPLGWNDLTNYENIGNRTISTNKQTTILNLQKTMALAERKCHQCKGKIKRGNICYQAHYMYRSRWEYEQFCLPCAIKLLKQVGEVAKKELSHYKVYIAKEEECSTKC